MQQKDIFQNTWESINLHITVDDIEVVADKETFVKSVILVLSGNPCNIDHSSASCILDISNVLDDFQQLPTILRFLAILSFKNARMSRQGGSSLLHGIILRPRSNNETYERIGYFWTADLDMIQVYLATYQPVKILDLLEIPRTK